MGAAAGAPLESSLPMRKVPKGKKPAGKLAGSYVHPSDTVPMRPEIGTQANFRKKKAPQTYRYDSSLSPTLEWDGGTGRAVGEWLIGVIERAAALPARIYSVQTSAQVIQRCILMTTDPGDLVLDPTCGSGQLYEVELIGLDTFDPTTMDTDHRPGSDAPCWMLDGDYNGLCFRASQVFFPRTAAWSDLKKSLKGDYDDTVWDHLAGTRSAPFEAGDHRQIAVKVIDDRGNELLVVRPLP